jgi:hypothetical protein
MGLQLEFEIVISRLGLNGSGAEVPLSPGRDVEGTTSHARDRKGKPSVRTSGRGPRCCLNSYDGIRHGTLIGTNNAPDDLIEKRSDLLFRRIRTSWLGKQQPSDQPDFDPCKTLPGHTGEFTLSR